MKKLFINAFLLLFLLPFASADLTGAYKCRTKDYIVFVRLTQMKEKLSGFMQVVSIQVGVPTPESTTYRLFGTVYGKAFALVREGVESNRKNIEGKLIPTGIQMSMPADDGYVAGMSLQPTSDEAWNKLVNVFSTECSERSYRSLWVGVLTSWISSLNASTSNAESQLKVNTEQFDRLGKRVKALHEEVGGLNDQLATLKAAKETADASVEDLNKKFSAMQKALNEKWSQEDQEKLNAVSSDFWKAKQASDDAQSKIIVLSANRQSLQDQLDRAQLDFNSVQEAIASAKSTIESDVRWRKCLREVGYAKHLRTIESGTILKARVVANTNVYVSPEDGAAVADLLDAGSIVDILPLDGGWTIVRVQNANIAWAKSSTLKKL